MYIGDRDIGETIRILRTERGISREDLAERVGISRSHLNKIEAVLNDRASLHIKRSWMSLNGHIHK